MSFKAIKCAMAQALPCTEKMVLVVLADFHNSKTGRCNPEKTTIAQIAGIDPRTADRVLIRLKERGKVDFEPTNGRCSNGYTLQFLQGSTPAENRGSDNPNPGTESANPGTESANPGTESANPGTVPPEPIRTYKNLSSCQQKIADDDLKIAEMIFQVVRKLNPNHKKPNLEAWANDIRKMRTIDDRPHDQIMDVFKWANADGFWQSNILSPGKLRKQFDQLLIKMNGAANPAGQEVRPPLGAFPE